MNQKANIEPYPGDGAFQVSGAPYDMYNTKAPLRFALRGFGVQSSFPNETDLIFGQHFCIRTCPNPSNLIWSRSALLRRGSQVVRQGSAKAPFVGSIPTLASLFHINNLIQKLR